MSPPSMSLTLNPMVAVSPVSSRTRLPLRSYSKIGKAANVTPPATGIFAIGGCLAGAARCH